jgi:hypothetical protein
MNNVRTLVVETVDDASDVLSEDFIKNVGSFWGALERTELDKLGITLGDVEKCYGQVSKLPRSKLLYGAASETQYQQVKTLLGEVINCKTFEKKKPADPLRTAYVVFNTESRSQTCVARIMNLLLTDARWNSQICDESIKVLKKPEVAGGTVAGVVLVSADLMKNPLSVAIVALLWEKEVPVVTVLSQEDFPQIKEDSYDALIPGSSLSQKADVHIKSIGEGTNVSNIVAPVKALFKILAWRFNPQDSNMVLQMEFNRIVERLSLAKKPDKEAVMLEVEQVMKQATTRRSKLGIDLTDVNVEEADTRRSFEEVQV